LGRQVWLALTQDVENDLGFFVPEQPSDDFSNTYKPDAPAFLLAAEESADQVKELVSFRWSFLHMLVPIPSNEKRSHAGPRTLKYKRDGLPALAGACGSAK
jgi:hypothetical protein